MKPKMPKETSEQKAVRLRSEADNLKATQSQLTDRTAMFRRIASPALSLVSGKMSGR